MRIYPKAFMNLIMHILAFLFLSLSYVQSMDLTHFQVIKQKKDSLYKKGTTALKKDHFTTANKVLSDLLAAGHINDAVLLRNSYYYQVIRTADLSKENKDDLMQENFETIYDAGILAIQQNDFVHSNDIIMWLASLGDIKRARILEAHFLDRLQINQDITPAQKKLMRKSQFETLYVQGQRALYNYKDPAMLKQIIAWLNKYREGKSWGAQLAREELEENLKKESAELNNSDSSSTEYYYPENR